jgi:hypothetical protein
MVVVDYGAPIDAPRDAACHPRASSRPVGGAGFLTHIERLTQRSRAPRKRGLRLKESGRLNALSR